MPPDARIAHVLHEGVAQRMTGVAAALRSADRLAPADRDRCVEELDAAIAELRTIIEEGAGADEHPAVELERLVHDFVVEGIRNAEKHGRPRVIAFTGHLLCNGLHLELLNDGVSPDGGAGTGVGLRLIREEALRHGGSVVAEPVGPDGWRTALTLPREAS